MRQIQPKKIIPLVTLLIFLTGCVKAWDDKKQADFEVPEGINPEEMYLWDPPSKEALALRRARQVELDALSGEIESLLFDFDRLQQGTQHLNNWVANWDPRLAELDRKITAQIEALEKKEKSSGKKKAALSSTAKKLKDELRTIRRKKGGFRFTSKSYATAYTYFRDKKYRQSINQFNRVMKTRYPKKLRDNILFGLGASYYKLKIWDRASKPLESLVANEIKGDKWYEGSLLLALTLYRGDQRSRALYIIENAFKRNPPERIRKLMERLKTQIQEDSTHATN